MGKDFDGTVTAKSKYPIICLEMKKNHKKELNQDSWFESQDLNQALLTNLLGSCYNTI
jgi:2-hydroxy-3-keto-5-methylthiopentenyl-1-phosphate phosphatase